MYQFYKIIFKSRSVIERLLLSVPIFITLLTGGSNPNYLPIHIDQVGHSNFMVNISSPAFYPDIKNGPIWIDGTLNLPIGIYHIDDFPESLIEDSIQVRNYFKWKQGDFEYREISVGSQSVSVDSGRIKFSGFGRSFPGSDGSLGPPNSDYKGNVLQNYLIEYQKYYNSSEFNCGVFYHNENVGLPLNDSNGSRFTESIHFGAYYKIALEKVKFNSSFAIQTGEFNRSDQITEYLVSWLDLVGDYPINNHNSIIIKYSQKNLSTESDELLLLDSEKSSHQTKLQYHHQISGLGLSFNMDFVGTTIFPGFEIYKSISAFKLTSKRSVSNEMSISDSMVISNIPVVNNSISIQYKNNKFPQLTGGIIGMLLEWKENEVQGLSGDFNFSHPWVSISSEGVFYDSQELLFDRYGYFSMDLHPKLWWSDRYFFIAGVEGTYYHLPGKINADLTTNTGVNFGDINYRNIGIINWKFGLDVKNFSLTYYTKFLSNQEIIMSPYVKSIEPFSYFVIDWRFIN